MQWVYLNKRAARVGWDFVHECLYTYLPRVEKPTPVCLAFIYIMLCENLESLILATDVFTWTKK